MATRTTTDPAKTTASSSKAGVCKSVIGEVKDSGAKEADVQIAKLHTVIFFPIDYDDPNNFSITAEGHADTAIMTVPHKDMLREPLLHQEPLREDDDDYPEWFEDLHFERVQKRLCFPYFENTKIPGIEYVEKTDAYVAEKDGIKFLHQFAVFMNMLQQNGFRIIYARNLQSALRHAKRVNELISPSSPMDNWPKTPNTTKSAKYEEGPSPASGVKTRKGKYDVMLITWRALGGRIHMDSRLYDAHLGENVLFQPTREEVGWDNAKIHDIKAFEAIAKKAQQWRPLSHVCELRKGRTCPWESNDRHKRVYEGKRQVLKRSHSSCTQHVVSRSWDGAYKAPICLRVLDEENRILKKKDLWKVSKQEDDINGPNKELKSETHPGALPKRAEEFILHNSHFYNYIHQEYVESLALWGELRVFVAMKAKKGKGNTAVEPQVIDVIKTKFNPEKPKKKAVPEYSRKDRKAGYHLTTFIDKTKQQLIAFLKERDLLTTELKKAKNQKLMDILLADNRNRIPAKDRNDPDGSTLVYDADDPDGTAPDEETLVNLEDGDPDKNPENDPEDDPHSDDPTVSIVRCTYKTEKMNVSRLNMDSTLGFRKYPSVTIPVIKNFALSQYRRLLRRYPEHFESLNIGARIDIGIGPKQALFINEVTRWWYASWFGGFEDVHRQGHVAQAFADSFALRYGHGPPRDDDSEAPESTDDEDDYDTDKDFPDNVRYKNKKGGLDGGRFEKKTKPGIGDAGGKDEGEADGKGGRGENDRGGAKDGGDGGDGGDLKDGKASDRKDEKKDNDDGKGKAATGKKPEPARKRKRDESTGLVRKSERKKNTPTRYGHVDSGKR